MDAGYSDTDCLKNFTTNALALTSDRKTVSIFFDGYLLKRFKVLFDIGPLKYMAGRVQTTFKLFSQY
jgi:hypothetical protein